jgi:hypothetical protein
MADITLKKIYVKFGGKTVRKIKDAFETYEVENISRAARFSKCSTFE